MPVQVQTPYKEYTANGVTRIFPLEFDCDKSEYLIVSLDGNEVSLGTWQLSNNEVIFNEAPPNGVIVSLVRNTPYQRTTNYQSYDNSFRPSPVNRDFDLIWWKLQELGYSNQGIWAALQKEIADRKIADTELKEDYIERDAQLKNYIDQMIALVTGDPSFNGITTDFVTEDGKTQHEINLAQAKVNQRVEIISDRAVFIEDYNPAYSTAPLSSRYSSLSDAQVDYPSAYSLTQSIDTAAIQEAVNSATGRKVLAKEGAQYYLTAINNVPDTQAGKYSILILNPVEMLTNGSKRAELIVPANQHGLVVNTDNFKLDGINFSGVGVVGTIGHHIKLYDSDNAIIRNANFKNCSDAAISFQPRLDVVINNFDDPSFDMWSVGCKNPLVENIISYDCYKDGALELMGTDGGVFRNNKFYNSFVHSIRCVGNRNALFDGNYGEWLYEYPNLSFSSFISFYSGAISPTGKIPRPYYNSSIIARSNNAYNVRDFFHFGIGAEKIEIYDNYGTCTNNALTIVNSGADIGRWGLKDSIITRNNFVAGNQAIYMDAAVSATPASAKLLDNVKIRKNDFYWPGAAHGVSTVNQTVSKNIANSEIKDNNFYSTDVSVSNSKNTISLVHAADSDFSGNITNMRNGLDLTVSAPVSLKYGKRERIGVTRASNQLILKSRNDLKTGARCTFETDGTLPAGLLLNTLYYISVIDTLNIKVNTDLAAAMAGTGVTMTDGGTGNHFINVI